jgi:thiamine biosynthesis lipoprotein
MPATAVPWVSPAPANKEKQHGRRVPETNQVSNSLSVTRRGALWAGQFHCMASPCEVLIECDSRAQASELSALAQQEALRIEQKFSRYRDDNIVHRINSGNGKPLHVDAETARLLDFAQHCYNLSDGYFDITSGILRRAWQFGPGARIPRQRDIDALLPLIGWDRVEWESPQLNLPAGMEIDFGGIGKEYAVDSVHKLLQGETDASFMVNFGGDCSASGPLADGAAWMTGIEDPHHPGDASAIIMLKIGALATSGDVFKFIAHSDKHYGHILNPRTGWPNLNSPLSVTIAAPTCTEAGILSTLAMLQGKQAEKFLARQGFKYWCYR